MYDQTLFEVTKILQADIRRDVEKARQVMLTDGATVKANRALPAWVDRLLHHQPFAPSMDAVNNVENNVTKETSQRN